MARVDNWIQELDIADGSKQLLIDAGVTIESIVWNHTNFIVIMHSKGEYSRYDHLSYKSARVKAGQYVGAGEEIARVGMTGINAWTDFNTLEVQGFN